MEFLISYRYAFQVKNYLSNNLNYKILTPKCRYSVDFA